MSRIGKGRRLSEQAVITLMNHAIYQFGNSMSVIFINLYLWRLTNDVFINGLYNLVALLAQAATTFTIGKVAKKRGRLAAYRAGILLTAVFYFCIIVARENIVQYYLLFAVIKGISQALYWLGYFTLVHEVSTDINRYRYLGWNQIVMNGTNLAGPAVSGFIVGLFAGFRGYMVVFIAAFIMFVIAALGSMRIHDEETMHRAYYMKYLPLIIKRQPNFKKALIGFFIIGFPNGILSFIPTILLYTAFNQEQSVAYLNVLFYTLSILSSYIISRVAGMEGTRKYLIVAAAGFTLSSLFLIWDISIWTVIVYMSTHSLLKPLQANSYEAYYYSWINHIPLKENFRVEAVVLRESIINLGRSFGIIMFLAFVKDIETSALPWIIFTVSAFQSLLPYLVKDGMKIILKR